jgi:hypothetical protein
MTWAPGRLTPTTKISILMIGEKAASITGLENPMWQLIISFITVAVFLGLKQGFSLDIGLGNLAPILLLGIVNTGIGCYFFFFYW